MGVGVALATIEKSCDELVDLARLEPPLILPFTLAAGASLDLPIQRVTGYASAMIFIVSTTGGFRLSEFARCEEDPPTVFSRVGGPIGTVASVDNAGVVVQVVAARRPTFGEEEFYRLTSPAGSILINICIRMVVIP